MPRERLREKRDPGGGTAAAWERQRRMRWRIGILVVVVGLAIGGAGLVLLLYAKSFLHVLYVLAGVTVGLLGLRLMRRNGQRLAPTAQPERFWRARAGYFQLFEGADARLRLGRTLWTEALLLRLVRALAGRRLTQLQRGLPPADQEAESQLKEKMLEAQVEAALQGHELASWHPADALGSGWQAVCTQCGAAVYASGRALHSTLAERCPGRARAGGPR